MATRRGDCRIGKRLIIVVRRSSRVDRNPTAFAWVLPLFSGLDQLDRPVVIGNARELSIHFSVQLHSFYKVDR